MTAICTIGIELSARTQQFLLGAEVVTLALFAVVALVKVYAGSAGPRRRCRRSRGSRPFAIDSTSALIAGVLLGGVHLLGLGQRRGGERGDGGLRRPAPGNAAVVSTLLLLGIYLIVSTAAQAFGGDQARWPTTATTCSSVARRRGVRRRRSTSSDHHGADLGGRVHADHDPADRPHHAVDGARQGASRASFGEIHPRFLTPARLDDPDGRVSIVWYVGRRSSARTCSCDSITALGLRSPSTTA